MNRAVVGCSARTADRAQNDGDHNDDLVLHDHLAPGERGIAAHLHSPEKETSTS